MSVEKILSRLNKVKPTGRGAYVACCPAHNDKTPSLAITANDDGRILINCFAGCETESVLDAISLKIEDLFPERLGEFKPLKRPFNDAQLLQVLAREVTIVALCGSRMREGPLSDVDKARHDLAVKRIFTGLDMAGFTHG